MDALLKALHQCYRHELTMVVRYVNFSIQVGGLDRLHLAEFFGGKAEESIGHARKIGLKIQALGGAPEGKVAEDVGAVPHDPHAMLQQALKDEQAAAALYAEAVPLVKQDLPLRETLVHILKDEQAGVDELKMLLARR